MAQAYAYRARDRAGKLVQGEMEASELKTIINHLWGQNLVIVSLEPKSNSALDLDVVAWFKEKTGVKFTRKVKAKELGFFCRQLATMINSGIPLLSCLSILELQKGTLKLKQAISSLKSELEQGKSISEGARKFPDVFPQIFVNMVEAGEAGGALDDVLMRLANHFDKEHEVIEKVKSAMTYPLVIFFVAVLCVAFLLGFILPKFTTLLDGFNVELPLITRIVLAASGLIAKTWFIIIPAAVLIYFAARRKLREERYKLKLDTQTFRVPVFGDLLRKREVSRFARTLGTLLRSGIPILQALEVVKKTTNNLLVRKSLLNAQQSIRDGDPVAVPLGKSGVFPSMVIQMIQTGEETGTLEDMLEKISVFYDREVDAVVNRLSSLIEPIFIVVLGLTIGIILLAVLLPVFKVITTVS